LAHIESETPVVGSATKRSRALLQRAIEVGISLGFLALALRGINFADLLAALRQANYWWLIPGVVITVALLFLKAWRWQRLILPEHRLPFKSVFTAMCAGYLASNVLPARAGELARLVLLVSEQPVSVARTFSTIIVERLLDLLTLIVVLAVLLPFVTLPEGLSEVARGITWAALAAALAMLIFSFWKERLLWIARRLFGRVRILDRPQVYDAIGHLIDGFATLRGRLGVWLIFVSLVGWLGVIGMAWSAGVALQLEAPVTAMAFAVVVTTLWMLVPSSPGYIGVFHYWAAWAVMQFGVPKDQAVSFALLWHATNYLTLCASGVIALWVHGTSLGQVMQRWRARAPVSREA